MTDETTPVVDETVNAPVVDAAEDVTEDVDFDFDDEDLDDEDFADEDDVEEDDAE